VVGLSSSAFLEVLMVRNGKLMFLGMSAFTGMLAVWSSLAGCQGGTSATTGASTNAGGSGGEASTTSSATNSGGAGTTSSASSMTTTTTGSSMGTGGTPAMTATITDITTNKIGPAIEVSLKGVVVMSQKFLVSKGGSGSCLWGVFVSEPGLAETKASSGIVALSYGVNASISGDAGKAFCPRLGIDPIGDAIPDDVAPGDVVDLTGETAYFLLPNCMTQPMGTTVGQYQIAKINPGNMTRTSTKGPVPAAHKMTAAQYAQLASPTDKAFHDLWGNVKVELDNAISEPQDDGTGMMGITDQFGHILVHDAANMAPAATDKVQVGDKLFYRGYAKAKNFCYDGPKYPVATTTFTAIDGFNYLDFCTWNVQPNNKCSDLTPPSPVATDCNSVSTACP
jgi:hypothetical protein